MLIREQISDGKVSQRDPVRGRCMVYVWTENREKKTKNRSEAVGLAKAGRDVSPGWNDAWAARVQGQLARNPEAC